VLIAPHYCVEEICLTGIRRAGAAYAQGNLRAKLARYHADVDATFYGWHDVWLNPARRDWNIADCVARIVCPILAIQGREDEYATLDQIEALPRYAPQTQTRIVENCGHFPHLHHADVVIAAIADFI
jgi:pimeloyl-ACP methyl ester carboxylesterase